MKAGGEWEGIIGRIARLAAIPRKKKQRDSVLGSMAGSGLRWASTLRQQLLQRFQMFFDVLVFRRPLAFGLCLCFPPLTAAQGSRS